PKNIEVAFLSKKFDSLEIKQLVNDLNSYSLSDTKLTIKQNNNDLKSEILSEINKSSHKISESDIKIQNLANQLNEYKVGDPILDKEIKIIFPEINSVSFGMLTNYSNNDSIVKNQVVIYKSEKEIDEVKLKKWLENKFSSTNIKIIKE